MAGGRQSKAGEGEKDNFHIFNFIMGRHTLALVLSQYEKRVAKYTYTYNGIRRYPHTTEKREKEIQEGGEGEKKNENVGWKKRGGGVFVGIEE